MAKFAHPDVLDQGPTLIKIAATKMLLISAYSAGDAYATVVANKLAEVAMTAGDYTLGSNGLSRTLTVAAGKTANLTAAATGTDAHLAWTDGVNRVLWVTDETTNPTGAITALVTFPGPVYTVSQPV